MRKIRLGIVILTVIVSMSSLCMSCASSNETKANLIPDAYISYTHYEIGNVIQDGKQAVFLISVQIIQ